MTDQALMENRLEQLATVINTGIDGIKKKGLEMLQDARDVGCFLCEAKERNPMRFGKWVELNCPRISYRTAQRWMELHRQWEKIEASGRAAELLSFKDAKDVITPSGGKDTRHGVVSPPPHTDEEALAGGAAGSGKHETFTQETLEYEDVEPHEKPQPKPLDDDIVSEAIGQMVIGVEEDEPETTLVDEWMRSLVAQEVSVLLDALWDNWSAEQQKQFTEWAILKQREINLNELSAAQKKPRARKKPANGKPTPFDEFWATVHRKVGQAKAKAAFEVATKRVQKEDECTKAEAEGWLTERMTAFAASAQARDKITGKLHPATWLNGGRYDDDEATWNEGDETSSDLDDYIANG